MSKTVENYYDEFAAQQIKTGVNLRHFQILRFAIERGLKKSSSVLEIGCGIGTFTGLLATYVKNGSVLATDISGESVAIARNRLSKKSNVEFVVTDMIDFSVEKKFDFIILPDVLEHIPIEQHPNLFKSISNNLTDNGKILIHIPHPLIIEHYHRSSPEILQVIDQAIHLDSLAPALYENGLMVLELKSYNLFHTTNDYQLISIQKHKAENNFRERSKLSIIFSKSFLRIYFFVKSL